MSTRWTGMSGLAKLATLFTITLVLSIGLCGSQFQFQPNEYVTIEGMAGFAGLIVSVPGLLVTGIIGLVRYIRARLGKEGDLL